MSDSQRKAFEEGHIETDAIFWDGEKYQPSNPGAYAVAVAQTANNLYVEFKRGWQAATEQGVNPVCGDSVSIDVSTSETTAGNRVFGTLTGERNGDPERTWLAELDHFNYSTEQGVGEPDENELWSVLEAATEAMNRKALPVAYISLAWNGGAEFITKRRVRAQLATQQPP